ncbi:transmembrane and TPR repeat-containing protein [Acrasis kona]|uniref:Transmembrane and TPR repeat-containing protein n=1 Tax=Acrasis kona TaxID=1008807 RepID=A0AAW2ZF19_9EUKA
MLRNLIRTSIRVSNIHAKFYSFDTRVLELGKLNSLAVTCQQLKQFPKAVSTYEKMLDISPDNVQVHLSIATVYQEMGSTFSLKAIDHLKKAISTIESSEEHRNFNSVPIYIQLSKLLREEGHLQDSSDYAQKATEEINKAIKILSEEWKALIDQGHTEEEEEKQLQKPFTYEDGTDENLDYQIPPLRRIKQELEHYESLKSLIK